MDRLRRVLLCVCFFVCPLLFFTNLTRNPYITQISLLNIAVLGAAAALVWERGRAGELSWPRTALDLPLLGFALACALSWVVAYAGHAAFFRPAMASEGAKGFLFLLSNAAGPFYLAVVCSRESGGEEADPAPWVGFALAWGLAWILFPLVRGPQGGAGEIWSQLWDGYGALLWASGLAWAAWLCRRGRWSDFLHLAFVAGFLASAYAVCQYFNLEFIWPQALNPYGGRSVSTFGNPNFMSSFNAMLLPQALLLFARARGSARAAYAVLVLTLEAALLASLTRSSWAGAAVGLGVLALSADFRRSLLSAPRPSGLLAAAGGALILAWPASSIVAGYAPSVIGRLREVAEIAGAARSYSPFYQRLLIWTCAWQMGAENPFTGKGWGCFELFYPFYQGPLLIAFDSLRSMRTHANNAHNEILEVWAQTGLLGLGALLWLWTTFAAACRRAFRSGGEAAAAAAAAGVAAMLADNLLNVSLHFTVPGFLFWWLAGSAVGLGTQAPERRARVSPGASRAAAAVLCAALASISWYWVRVWFRETHYFAGFKLIRQAAPASAIRELEASKDWGPREVNAIYELGNAYAKAERFPEAAAAFRDALRANAGYDEIYFNLATILAQRLGRGDEALRFYEAAWWINPAAPELYGGFGSFLIQRGAPARAEAVELLQSGVRFFPNNPAHWNNLGYLHTLEGRLQEAEDDYNHALLLDPGMTVAERNLAALAAQSKRRRGPVLDSLKDLRELEKRAAARDASEETLALAERVARALPDSPKALFYYGTMLLARSRPQEAVAVLERVVALQPGNAWPRVNLGHAYRLTGRPAEAKREFETALSLDPGNAPAREGLKVMGL